MLFFQKVGQVHSWKKFLKEKKGKSMQEFSLSTEVNKFQNQALKPMTNLIKFKFKSKYQIVVYPNKSKFEYIVVTHLRFTTHVEVMC